MRPSVATSTSEQATEAGAAVEAISSGSEKVIVDGDVFWLSRSLTQMPSSWDPVEEVQPE